MSRSKCNSNDTTGFPLTISQPLKNSWPATSDSQEKLKHITAPTDFTVNWGPPTQSATINITQTTTSGPRAGVFQINGLDTITDNTNLVFGTANYYCSNTLSIVQNQHRNLNNTVAANYELILAFRITNKNDNPTSPDVILLTRPIIFGAGSNAVSPFLTAVDTAAASSSKNTTAPVDMSKLFGYDTKTLMPMVSYQTCLPARIENKTNNPGTAAPIAVRMRVNVVMEPLYVNDTQNGLGLCSSINKYTLVTRPYNLLDIFLDNTTKQALGQINPGSLTYSFSNGLNENGPTFLVDTNINVPISTSSAISGFSDVIKKIQILVPESLLGKSLAEISKSRIVPSSSKKKAFKCYTIDPSRDVVGDQIMVDPTNGERLIDTMNKNSDSVSGGYSVSSIYYTLYGDEIQSVLPARAIPLSIKYKNMSDINAFVAQDGPLIRIAFSSLSNVAVFQSLRYTGTASNLTEANFHFDTTTEKFFIKETGGYRINEIDGLKDDTGLVHINLLPMNTVSATSGISAGDVEDVFVIITIVIVSILLFGYLFFIGYKIMFRDLYDGFPWIHIIAFFIILILLILFSVFVEKPLQKS
jgi:hypothetical protein